MIATKDFHSTAVTRSYLDVGEEGVVQDSEPAARIAPAVIALKDWAQDATQKITVNETGAIGGGTAGGGVTGGTVTVSLSSGASLCSAPRERLLNPLVLTVDNATKCSATLPLPEIDIIQGDYFYQRMQDLCSRPDSQMDFVHLREVEVAMDYSMCPGDVDFATAKKWWQKAGNTLKAFPYAGIIAADFNVRETYRVH